MKPYPFQVADLEKLRKHNYRGLVNAGTGVGKSQPLDSLVLTPSGFKRMGEMRVGDEVVVPSGGVALVKGVFPQGLRRVYTVHFADGRTVDADEDHLWTVLEPGSTSHPRRKRVETTRFLAETVTTGVAVKRPRWTVERIEAPDLGTWGSSIDPYSLGLLIGDGGLSGLTIRFTNTDQELVEHLARSVPDTMQMEQTSHEDITYSLSRRPGRTGKSAWAAELSRLGLMGSTSKQKKIPVELLNASAADRLALLQGILDTDGTPSRNGADIIVASKELRDQVTWLAHSLGGKSSESLKMSKAQGWTEARPYYRARIVLPSHLSPFRLQRHRERLKAGTKYAVRDFRITDITFKGVEETQCILVDHPEHEYVTDGFIRTHNTATGLFAAREGGAGVTLVIAPDQTHESAWAPTAAKINGIEARVIGSRNKATKQALTDFELGFPGVYMATPEYFTRADISAWGGDLLIVDEAHKLARPGGKGQRKLGGFDSSDPEPLARRFDGVMHLSGTMLRNRFEYAWSHGRSLWPELNKRGQLADASFFLWQSDRMLYETITTGVTWLPVSWEAYENRGETWGKVIGGEPHLGTLKTARKYLSEAEPGRWISEAPCVITHFKREQCCEFHPNGFMELEEPLVKREIIQLAPAQKKAIKELENHMMTWLEENPLVVDIPLTKAIRVRQFTLGVPTVTYDEEDNAEVTFAEDCVSPFYNRLEEFLTDEVPDENVVVFVDSQKFAAVVTARLNKAGISAFEFSGATRKTRMADAEQFGSKYRVVVGVLAAIAEGLDLLQYNSRTDVWLSRSTDETLNEQAAGRLDRNGQRTQVFRLILEDDLGLSEGRYSDALEKRLLLNRSLRKVA